MTDQKAVPHASARRRYLAILFSDLSASARLAATMETEDFAELLAALRRACEAVIPKHGGTILQIQGDGILAAFGYPNASEDDGRRATEAALDLHDLVRGLRFDFPLPMPGTPRLHTGIHSGLVLLEEGDAVAGRMVMIGNAANVAARLCDAAKSDEILVSSETLGAERHFFQTGDERALDLQGIADPIMVHRITGRTPVGTRFEARTKRGLTPFVGRKAELQALLQGLDDVVSGKPRYLAVVASTGLGKTRLAEEFLARAATLNVAVHRGYCESYLSAEPAQPFLQILRSLCGMAYGMPAASAAEALQNTLLQIDPALLVHRPALLRALSLDGPSKSEADAGKHAAENIVAAIVKLFDALATATPLLVFIDDWQWADDATRQVLAAIRSLEHRAILVLVAARESEPGDVGISGAQILTLMPFSGQEADQTIAHLLPGRDKFVLEEIRSYAGGNPLFVEELCHSAAHDYADRRSYSGKAWLDKLIEARVERLPPAQLALVRTAAVIGNVIPLPVLESITGYSVDDPLILALTERDLIYPGEQRGTLRFKHGIARDVIYESVGLRERRALHMRTAQTLKQQASSGMEEELYELLAYHYGAGGNVLEAARYCELAGDKAMAASALDRAQVQYVAALAAIDPLEQTEGNYQRWMQIAQRLAMACVFDPSRERLEVLRRAVELAAAHDDQYARAYAEFWVGYIYYALGESGQAIAHMEVALEGAQTVGDAPLVRQIRATLGQACAAACDYDKALVLLDEAIDARHQRRRSGRPAVGFAYTLACKASVLGDRGLFDEAYQCFDEALESVRGAGHQVEGSILCWRSGVALWQGQWEEAGRCALEAQSVAERVKSLYLYAMSISLGAYAAWSKNGTIGSLQTIVDATSWLENRDRGLFISLNYGWLADGLVARKDWQVARGYAARALLRARNHDRIGGSMACRAMARASAAGKNRHPAEYYLALAISNAQARGSPHEIALTQLCEAEIRLASEQRSQAAGLLEQAGDAFEAMAMTWHLDKIHQLRRDL